MSTLDLLLPPGIRESAIFFLCLHFSLSSSLSLSLFRLYSYALVYFYILKFFYAFYLDFYILLYFFKSKLGRVWY